ncbi:MAG: hypothetical protein PHY94_05470 [Candidatus Omnitrophica bacterium]|nr:hypothetical protein [Candidatus Omnitrophota bacterium]
MLDAVKDSESFIRSVPNVLRLEQRAHIVLLGYYMRSCGSTGFTPRILQNTFKKSKLHIPDKLEEKLKELSDGETSPLLLIEKGRYSLSLHGLDEAEHYLKDEPQIQRGTEMLKNLLPKILDKNQRIFLGEAITCAERGLKRASIIMTWLFVMDFMQEFIIANKKSEFNIALLRRPDANRLHQINTKDNFEDMKESIFIEIMRSSGAITPGACKILKEKLDIRNTCAHPSDIFIHESKVVNFIEDLIENVVLKYK